MKYKAKDGLTGSGRPGTALDRQATERAVPDVVPRTSRPGFLSGCREKASL